MADSLNSPTTAGPPRGGGAAHAYRWPAVVVLITLALLLSFWLLLWFARDTARDAVTELNKNVQSLASRAESIAAKFKQGTITTTFLAALPELAGTGIGNLDVATSRATEIVRREDSLSIFGDRLPLGTTVSEIRVPVTYRYHVPFGEAWRLEVSNQHCIVYAPALRPTLPPAIHTDRMEKMSANGWARFNKLEQLDALERSLTPTLSRYAADRRHLEVVRETARKTVANFVRAWLLREDHWREDRFRAVTVIFADDPEVKTGLLAPTLELP